MGENIGDTLLQLKRAKQALACAKEILSPYVQSTNELIKGASVLATKGVETLSGGANKVFHFKRSSPPGDEHQAIPIARRSGPRRGKAQDAVERARDAFFLSLTIEYLDI
jgi:hypothetical protein